MLQTFRDNLKGTVATILVGLICIPFALFGIDSLFNTQAEAKPVAEVNGEKISETDLQRAIQMRKSQLSQQFGENLPPQFLSDERLREPVLESLVQRAVLLERAKSEGMTVGSAAIDQVILGSADFQVDGKFDPNRYQALIRSIGYTSQSYKDIIQNEVVLNQFASGLTQSNFALASEVDTLAKLNLQTRSFDYVVLEQEPFLEEVVVSDEEIQAFYEENLNRYLSPETVVIEAIELSSEQLAANINVDDTLIEEEYEQEKQGFMPSTQRRAAHILLDPSADDFQEVVDTITQRLSQDEEFSSLAKEYSQDFGSKDSGGDVGYSTGDSFVPEFEQALVELAVGQVSEPVETEFGVHIIKLLDVSESAMPTLDEMRLSIAQKIKQSMAEEIFIEKLNDFKDLTYNVDDLAPVAEQLELELWVSEEFSRFNGVGIAAAPLVTTAAFSEELINSGFSSDPIEIDDQTVVVIRVKTHNPESTQPLAAVKADVEQSVKSEKASVLVESVAAQLIESARQGQKLSDLAKEKGLEVTAISESKRQQADVDQTVVTEVFALPVPDEGSAIYHSVSMAGSGVAVIGLNAVHEGDASSISDQERSYATSQIATLMGEADFISVSNYLVSKAKVKY